MEPPILLRTKFLFPRPRPEQLPRPHLLAWLDQHLDQRLILVSAAAGYGKTTLLAEWAAASPRPLAWYQLDAADSDPAVFLAYLIECLRTRLPGAAALGEGARALLAGTSGPAAPERALAVLLNEMAEAEARDWTLVLEDYHFIGNPAVHALVDALVEHGPPGLHLIVSTRSDPPLALARLRARGLLAELRAPELRFSGPELSAWLSRAAPGLAPGSVQALGERTEGWAAGVQLALASIAGKDQAAAERFLADVSGTQRFVFEFLAGEVFRQQPPELQRFLMYTAVLAQMNAGACAALVGQAGAQATLADLERDNLFIVSLDDRREWFRYHYLFREFLLARLRREQPEQAAALELAAGRYYEAHGEPEVALTHYLQGGDPAAAAHAMAAFAPEYIESGRVEVLQRYFSALPEAVFRAQPALLLDHGSVLRQMGQAGAAIARYDDARAAFALGADRPGECRALTELAEVARSQGDYRRAQVLAARAVELISTPAATGEPDHAARARALMALAKSEGFVVGMDRGRALAEEAVEEARRAGAALSPRARAALLRSLGQICWWHGDPHATVRYCQEVLQAVPDELTPIAAEALITMATPYLYWGELEPAARCAERGLEIVQRLQLHELLPLAYATLGNVLTRRGETVRAEACLRQAMEYARGLGLETYAQVMAAGFLAYNLVGQGRLDEARQIAETAMWPHAGSPDTYEICVCHSVLADIALESGHLDEAERLFTALLEVDRRRQFRIPLAMVCFGLAYIDLQTGRPEQGLAHARESLALLESTGALQLYRDQGERAAHVVGALRAAGERSAFLSQLAEAPAAPASGLAIPAVVQVRTLGQIRVTVSGQEVAPERWTSAKARDLLAYFVTFRRESVPLERALEALWPEAAGGSKTAFHTALYRLRQALRAPEAAGKFILVDAGEYRLDTARFQVDVDEFDAALAHGRAARGDEAARWYGRAAEVYGGEYCDNLYYDWVLPERRRLREAFLAALRWLSRHHLDAARYETALGYTARALQVDGLLEEVVCDGMRCHAALGDRAAVVRQYDRLRQALAAELRVEPLPATQRLFEELVAAAGR